MEPPAKSGSLRGHVARSLLFGVLVLVLRFAYVVIVHGEHCDAGDFCFFSPPGGLALGGAAGAAGTKVFIRGGEGTANPAWFSREWRRAVDYYSAIFQDLTVEGFLSTNAESVCVDAGMGQQVLALREIGVPDAVGISKKEYPPLVVSGDLFHQPFGNNTSDFVFASRGTIELSKRPADLASEIARILKPEGFLVVHTSSAGDQYSLYSFLGLFPGFRLVRNREIDGFDSLATREAVLQKLPGDGVLGIASKRTGTTSSRGGEFLSRCSIPDHKLKLLSSAESLIEEEPLKPWITLKRNVKNIKYLPSIADISFKSRYVYVDVGARSYGSSIGSWFKKQYPKQNKTFDVYAIEADRTFHAEYASKKGVSLLPYAAWVRNETLLFEINGDPAHKAKVKGRGMGRIQPAGAAAPALSLPRDVHKIRGFDFAEWLKSTVTETDYVVMKMDVEGTEFELIPRLFETGAICLIHELFLECHYNRWQRCCPGERTPKYQNTYAQCVELFSSLRGSGVLVHQWW